MLLKPRYRVDAYLDGHYIEPEPKVARKLLHRYHWRAVRQRDQLMKVSPPGWWYCVALYAG